MLKTQPNIIYIVLIISWFAANLDQSHKTIVT
jgi:hypothetical protein